MEAVVGELLVCERDPENASDRYAVAVKNEGSIIGHLPRMYRVFTVFATVRYYRMYGNRVQEIFS